MGILPIILFLLLGSGVLLLIWRWKNRHNQEALTALKGLAYLKREIIQVQNQVHDLESLAHSIQTDHLLVQNQIHDLEGELSKTKEVYFQTQANREVDVREEQSNVLKLKEPEFRPIEAKEKSNLYMLKPKHHPSPKYQEVLKLAANGQQIPEIAQNLFLSQDAVRMVLQIQSKGGA